MTNRQKPRQRKSTGSYRDHHLPHIPGTFGDPSAAFAEGNSTERRQEADASAGTSANPSTGPSHTNRNRYASGSMC